MSEENLEGNVEYLWRERGRGWVRDGNEEIEQGHVRDAGVYGGQTMGVLGCVKVRKGEKGHGGVRSPLGCTFFGWSFNQQYGPLLVLGDTD